MKSQDYGCMKKICTLTSPGDMSVWTGKFSQGSLKTEL